ncbi:hypothetical protein AMAG_04065 [Allomyces macrogynus ATCC 38327]|uniref:Cyclic nucleotide-binding domain-containing protein n=1 Tax=Allomyces macrogynus (strain ATCC 38327) TaxID=578462 RepID=A0A0L0S7W0_ALLM3|nr:hypothetical protein AMAG_04065 [Allomyces macrogynus ATCC 38327]|eukprot:KNE58495.1 hypothetical protein AMAG_04065 [Allomyces macrogynus ATCC 38327]
MMHSIMQVSCMTCMSIELRKAAILRTSKFDKATQSRVLAFYEFLWQRNGGINTQDLFADLPTAFQTELAVWMNGPLLSSVPIFHDTEEGFMRMLSLALRPVMFLPNEFVVRRGDLGSEMYMVHSGILEVVSDDGTQVFDRICDGGFFGEISLFFARPRTANVRTVTFVDLYVLTKAGLDDVLQFYPSIKLKIMATAQQRLQDLEKRLRTRTDSLKPGNPGVLTAVVPPSVPVPLASAPMASAPASPTVPVFCEQDDERPPPSPLPPPSITMNSPTPLPGTPVGASTCPNASSTTTSSGSVTSSVYPSTARPTLPHPDTQARSSVHLAPNSHFTTAGRGGGGSNISLAARSQQALLSLARALGSHDTMHSASGTMGARRGSTALERAARNQAVLMQRPRQASIASREIMPGTSLAASRRASLLSVQERPETVARSQNLFVSTNEFATPEGAESVIGMGVGVAPASMPAAVGTAAAAAVGMDRVTTVQSTVEPKSSGSGGDPQTGRFFSDGSHLDLNGSAGPGRAPAGNQVAAFSDLEPAIDAPHEDESATSPSFASVMSLDARSSRATRQTLASISSDLQSPVLDRAQSNTVLTGRPLRPKQIHGAIAEEGLRDPVSARLKSLSASLNAMGGSLTALGEVVLPDSLCGVHYTQIATSTVPAGDTPPDAAPTTSTTIYTHQENPDLISTTPQSSRRVSRESSMRGLPTSASVMSTHSQRQLGGGSLVVPRALERTRTPSTAFRNIMSGGLTNAMILHGSSSGENGSVGLGSLSRQRSAVQGAHSGAVTADVELLLAGLAEPAPPPAPSVSQVRAQRGRGVGGIRGAFMPVSGPLPRLVNQDSSGAILPGFDALVSGPLPRGVPSNSDERVGVVRTNSQEATASRTTMGSVSRSPGGVGAAGASGTLSVTPAPRKGSSPLHRAIVPSDAGSSRSRSELELGAESLGSGGNSTSTASLKTAKPGATLPNRGGGGGQNGDDVARLWEL